MMLVLLLGSCKALKLTPPPVSYSSSKNFADTFNAIVLPTYGRYPVGTLISGEGSYITTDKPDGNSKTTKYLDFVSGIATNSLGHNNPAVVGAVSKQLKEFGHVSNLYYTENQARLGQFLLSNTFKNKKGKVFFCNSGAETNEGVIKLMRKWGRDRKKLTHPYIITMSNSFHGRTTGALAATNSNAGKYQDGFTFAGEVNRGFKTVEYNNVQDLRAMVKKLNKSRSLWDVLRGRRKGLAGIMMETLQGEGGVLPSTKEFIKVRERSEQQAKRASSEASIKRSEHQAKRAAIEASIKRREMRSVMARFARSLFCSQALMKTRMLAINPAKCYRHNSYIHSLN